MHQRASGAAKQLLSLFPVSSIFDRPLQWSIPAGVAAFRKRPSCPYNGAMPCRAALPWPAKGQSRALGSGVKSLEAPAARSLPGGAQPRWRQRAGAARRQVDVAQPRSCSASVLSLPICRVAARGCAPQRRFPQRSPLQSRLHEAASAHGDMCTVPQQFQLAVAGVFQESGHPADGLQGGLPALRYPVSAPAAAGWPAGEMRLQLASLLRQAHGASRATVDQHAQRSPG